MSAAGPDSKPRPRGRLGATALAAALCALSGAAAAQSVRVGAGEHADHSRVVFNLRAPDGWTARSTADGVELRLPGVDWSFDARDVAPRRKAHRVDRFSSRVEDGQTVVTLGFDCRCRAQTQALRGGLLVVEVRDGAARAETAQPANAPRALVARAARPETPPAAEPIDGPIPTGDAERAPRTPPSLPADRSPDAPLLNRAAEVEHAREMLLRQLRAAADQGIITFRDGRTQSGGGAGEDNAGQETAAREPAARESAAREQAAREHADPARDAPEHAMPDHAAPNHAARSHAAPDSAAQDHAAQDHAAPDHAAPDSAEADAAPVAVEAPPLAPCLPDEALDAGAWLDARPYAEALKARRARLYDELNRVDADAVIGLSAFYLSHLLGPEAAHTPVVFRVESERARLMVDLARVVKGSPPAPDSPFGRAEPCAGRHGLWQAAAMSDLDPALAMAAYDMTGRELARTPRPFRRFLGGRIGRAAIRLGRLDAADDILRLLLRNQDPPSADMLMIRAELALVEGRTLAAQMDFEALIDARDPQAPEAAIRFSETLTPPRDAERARAHADILSELARQYRSAPVGVALIEAEARLLTRFGDLNAGLAPIQQALARMAEPDPALVALRQELIAQQIGALESNPRAEAAVDAIDAVALLDHGPEADALRARLARVLIDTGTPHLAMLVLDDAVAARHPQSERLRAEAEIASQLPDPMVNTAARAGHDQPAKDAHAADAHAADAHAADAHAADAHAADAHATDGHAPEAQAADGHAPEAQAADGHAPEAQAADGHAPEAQAADAHAPEALAPEPHAPDAHTPDGLAPDPAAEAPAPIGAAGPAAEHAPAVSKALEAEALKHYLAGEPALPPQIDAALETAPEHEARALRGLFEPASEGRPDETGVEAIARGKKLIENLDSEIQLLKGIATDG